MGLLAWLFGVRDSTLARRPPRRRDVSTKVPRKATFVSGGGCFSLEVVGESHYQENLIRICGRPCAEGHAVRCRAILILEDSNPHDPNAVRIEINRLTVGYLPRPAAKSWRKQIAEAKGLVVCDAMIQGGWDRGPDDCGQFGVRLDIHLK